MLSSHIGIRLCIGRRRIKEAHPLMSRQQGCKAVPRCSLQVGTSIGCRHIFTGGGLLPLILQLVQWQRGHGRLSCSRCEHENCMFGCKPDQEINCQLTAWQSTQATSSIRCESDNSMVMLNFADSTQWGTMLLVQEALPTADMP